MSTFDKKRVYVRKVGQVSKHTLWLVDGTYIRKEMDENFALYDGHHHLRFIPKYEFWIEDTSSPAEWYFFVHELICEQAEMIEGKSREEAQKIGEACDKKERQKMREIEHGDHAQTENKKLLAEVKRAPYEKYKGSVSVYLVDGMAVRDLFSTDYTDGGHGRVYPFIPKNEIWLEDTLAADELPFLLLHELHERYLMGEGKDYPHAHMGATEVEDYYRDHPKEVDERLKEEMAKNDAQGA